MKNPMVRELLIVTLGEAVGVGLMIAVFALLNRLDQSVVLGGILGGVLTVGNFGLTALAVYLASKKAAQQNVKGAQGSMMSSMTLRHLALLIILVLIAGSDRVNVIALVVPLLFIRPVLTLGEIFRKKGDAA